MSAPFRTSIQIRCPRVAPALVGALALVGCPSAPPDSPPPDPSGWAAIVVAGPFSGDVSASVIHGASLEVSDGLVGLTGSDWVPAVANGSPYLLGRFGVDAARRYADRGFGAPLWEVSTGAGGNPQDAAECGGRLFVPRYDRVTGEDAGGDVLILDPASGATLGTVDLSAWVESGDETPEPVGLVRAGGDLLLPLQRFDQDAGWVADPVGYVARIDCADGEVLGVVPVGPNPRLSPLGDGRALLVTDGAVSVLDGEVVREVIDEATLGGEVVAGAGVGAPGGVAVLAVEDPVTFENHLVCVDLEDGATRELPSQGARVWGAEAAPDGSVWILWRDNFWTPDPEPGGIGRVDPAACVELGPWIELRDGDPGAVAFIEE